MTIEVFLMALLLVSTLTSLMTEAIKLIFAEHNWKYSANTIAGICAVVVALLVSIGYVLFAEIAVTVQVVIVIIALIIMSWLCAMLGYDKIMQALEQFKNFRKKRE